ncbi:unnamed protein product [Camellia sinensis]
MENGTSKNGVCSSESINGAQDVWSCNQSLASSADHLVVMVHGILGSKISLVLNPEKFSGKHSYLKTCATVGAFGSPESSGSGDGNNSSNNDGGSNPDFFKISLVL